MPVRVRPLECGWLTSDMGTMLSGRIGEFRMPVAAFLVEHERGTLVFDTGMHPDLVHDSGRLGPIETMFAVDLDESALLGSRLRSCGVDPAQVDMAVLSHLHYDHCGGLVEVPESRLVVQHDEWTAAQDPVLAELGVYHPADFDTGPRGRAVGGAPRPVRRRIRGAVPTPGHSAGHQSLLIEGRLLLVGDACYCQLALDEDVLPPIAADAERQRAGFAWLRQQSAAGVQLVYSHDPVQWPTLGAVALSPTSDPVVASTRAAHRRPTCTEHRCQAFVVGRPAALRRNVGGRPLTDRRCAGGPGIAPRDRPADSRRGPPRLWP